MGLQVKRFTKIDESFVCENCGFQVVPSSEGSCRNHCPQCLFSKHLDVNPGDRLAMCNGSMKPVDVEQKSGVYRILHKCIRCGFSRWNKSASEDDLVGFYEKKKP